METYICSICDEIVKDEDLWEYADEDGYIDGCGSSKCFNHFVGSPQSNKSDCGVKAVFDTMERIEREKADKERRIRIKLDKI